MATITKRDEQRAERRWQARVRRSGFPAQTRSFPTKTEAEAWARDVEAEYDKGHAIDQRDAREMSLGNALRRYLAEVTPLHKGAKTEGYRIRQLLHHPICAYSLANLTRNALTEYREQRLQAVSGSTARKEMQVMALVIDHARRDWGVYLAENPVRMVRLPKENAARERRLRPGEEAVLLTECRAARAPYLEHAVIVAIETAMRQSEMLALTWDRIDLEKRVVRLAATKNGEPRPVPLTRRAVAALAAMKLVRVYEWTKHNTDGPFRWVGATVIRHAFMRARDKAGMPDLRFHDLRHEATSRLFEKGLNTMEVASITGHKTLSMLRRYSHLSMDHLLSKLD
ncbi:site-specific recombinase XerD [Paraburkholderia sp. BL27I4N3]|uniref:site-specific integrase n=1 Tax=Paraburkholderia sp. BL27I4N3 TaxID=1938805 RepID=UPI000E23D904|nr:site-specific integrase [Paraburkholderia sp. BL27I4N3]REE19465.1 site-specific recombinase XerD [Paraburkholderia sp. BL27I4N3]